MISTKNYNYYHPEAGLVLALIGGGLLPILAQSGNITEKIGSYMDEAIRPLGSSLQKIWRNTGNDKENVNRRATCGGSPGSCGGGRKIRGI